MSKNPPKSGRKTPEPEKTPQVPKNQQVTAEPPPTETAENDEEIERIGIPIYKKTGLPAWNRMRSPESAKATLRTIARDPAITGGAGTAESAALVPLCAQAVLLLGVIGEAYAKKNGYANPHVMAVTTEEAVPIGQMAMAVLMKYSATMKYAEEWMLGGALIGLFSTKAMQLQKANTPAVPMHVPPSSDAA
jgi:hypothetical protein